MKIKQIIKSIFTGPLGDVSIKRIMGTICIISLIVALFLDKKHFDPNLIGSITYLALGCVAGTVLEKFSPQIKGMGEQKDLVDIPE